MQKFTNPLPSYDPLFTSPEAKAALERTMAVHFMRTGQFGIAETFLSVSAISSVVRKRSAHFATSLSDRNLMLKSRA